MKFLKYDVVKVKKGENGRDYFKAVGRLVMVDNPDPTKRSVGKLYLHWLEGEFVIFPTERDDDAAPRRERAPAPPPPGEDVPSPPGGDEPDIPF